MNKILVFLCLLIFLLFPKNVSSVTTVIENFPATISSDPFTLDISIASAAAGINYLRIDLYKVSTTNYFGETFNGSTWYNSGDYILYFPITIQSGSNWKGQIQGKLGSPTQSQFDEEGAYKMRVRRYTSSGNYNTTEANNSAVDISINFPTATAAQIPTAIPTATIVPSPSSSDTSPTESACTKQACLSPTTIPMTPTPINNSYENIYISEAMVNPVSGEKEWVEIYNNNDFPVSLTDWFIDDIENGGSSPKTFLLNIDRKNYNTIEISSSIFNNSGDSVRLLDFNGNLKDGFEYGQSESGKTFGRKSWDSDDFCIQESSKNNANNQCIYSTPIPVLTDMSINPPPTIKIVKTDAGPVLIPTKGHVLSNSSEPIPTPHLPVSEVLGISTNSGRKNINLINLLSFLSLTYSLLTITSILFKMKLNHGKNKKFYSSTFRPPRRK